MSTGYIVFAHGSSIETANQAVRTVAAEMAERGGLDVVADRVTHVVVVPYFLTLGLHLKRDLPRLIDEVKQTHPNVRIDVAPPLDRHPAMVDILLDRARETSCKPA